MQENSQDAVLELKHKIVHHIQQNDKTNEYHNNLNDVRETTCDVLHDHQQGYDSLIKEKDEFKHALNNLNEKCVLSNDNEQLVKMY